MEILPYHFLLLLLPLYFFITLKTRNNGQGQQNKPNSSFPPCPPKLSIIGFLHQLIKHPHQALSKLSKTHGPVMLMQFGRVQIVVISSAEAAEQVLKTYDLELCSRPLHAGSRRLSYNCIDIIFAPYGEYWREIRKICVLELFSKKRVQSFKLVREEEVDSLIDSISSKNGTTPVDVYENFSSFTHKTICRVAFGSSTSGRTRFDDERFIEIISEFMLVLSSFSATDFLPKVGWIIDRITGSHGRTEKCFHDLDKFFQQMIDQHADPERLKPVHEDIIDVLLNIQKDPESKIRLTQDHVKAIVQNVFVGGVDTSAVTMTWAMAELAKNPEAMKKVQEEIRSHVGSKGKVEESDLDNFHHLKMVVKETLRLHPPAVLLARESMQHSKIDGYDIYPQTVVIINSWAIARNSKYWQNPEEFFPERFKDNSIEFAGSQNFEYLPFGGGRRVCPGMNMGLGLTELVLASVLYAFDWELPKGMKKEDLNMEESPGSSVRKKYPLELVPIKRHMVRKFDQES